MIWKKGNDGNWSIGDFKSVDWSSVVWSSSGKTQCPVCASEGRDNHGDNFFVYGLDDEGNPLGGKCFSCGTVVVSYDVALEDEESKGSYNRRIDFNMSSVRESKAEKKLKETRLSKEELQKIQSELSSELKVPYRGLDKGTCKELGVLWKYVERTGELQEMWFPAHIKENGELVVTGYKIRKIRDSQGNKLVKGKDNVFYSKGYVGTLNLLGGQTNAVTETIIVVGGEIDLITTKQVLAEKLNRSVTVVTSLLGESATADVLKSQIEYVNKHKKIILALDADDAGQDAQSKCISALPEDKIFLANLKYKDANDYLKNKDVSTFHQDFFWNAQPVKNYGIMDSSDIFKTALESAVQERIPLPPFLSSLNDMLRGGIGLQEIVVLASPPSLGKSVYVNEINLHWIMNSPYKLFIVSTEDSVGSYTVKIASRIIGNKILGLETSEERVKVLQENEELVNKYLKDENGVGRFKILDSIPSTIEGMKEVILQAIKVHGCQVIVLDTMSSIIGSKDLSTQEEFMNFLEHTRRNYNVTFICVTHTKKSQEGKALSEGGQATEEMIRGSGSISQTATLTMLLRRNKLAEDEIERNTTYVDIVKARTVGTTSRDAAKIYYNNDLHTLFDYEYAEKNNFFRGVSVEDFKTIQDVNKSVGVSVNKEEFTINDLEEEDEELPF